MYDSCKTVVTCAVSRTEEFREEVDELKTVRQEENLETYRWQFQVSCSRPACGALLSWYQGPKPPRVPVQQLTNIYSISI